MTTVAGLIDEATVAPLFAVRQRRATTAPPVAVATAGHRRGNDGSLRRTTQLAVPKRTLATSKRTTHRGGLRDSPSWKPRLAVAETETRVRSDGSGGATHSMWCVIGKASSNARSPPRV